ncbi:MAG: gamma-glutamyltransferase family protein [Chloroflexota bacterium]|nr:gamma-glutamyltransferase family protein [Chloroflexota bacterium]
MVQWYGAHRPAVMGAEAMISSTHYLATTAGLEILKAGGNAIDAGVAAGLCINVLEPHLTGLGGVAPIMAYEAATGQVGTISGLGRWPAAASIGWFRERHGGDMPEGIPRTVTPAAAGAWLAALGRWGTMPLARVAAPAIELAERGFPVYPRLAQTIAQQAAKIAARPADAATFLPNGRPPRAGERWRQPDLANTLRRLVAAERGAAGREAGLEAARRLFYEGEIAEAMARFCAAEGGLLTGDDLARFRVGHEPPVSVPYREYTVYACGPWCQGPVVPQALAILAGDDLRALGHNSPDYLHLLVEALKLAFADRDKFYGDPDFVPVPTAGLLSPGYAAARRERIDPRRAWPEMPPFGDPRPFMPAEDAASVNVTPYRPEPVAAPPGPDTAYCCVVDRWGNAFSATPSDPVLSSPIVPGLGFSLSSRGSQSWLDPAHASSVQGGKRPRLTPNPALATREGRIFMPFGCPGGDGQTQAMLQVFLNVVEFGMNPQRAIEEPRVIGESFPDSFWPHGYQPGLLNVEGRVAPDVRAELARRGHRVNEWDAWNAAACAVCAIVVDPPTGTRIGGADPRRECYALGW